jgi:hypothetical protein
MAPKALPSPEVLRQLLRYEPETGKLFWKERPPELFASKRACSVWNARYPGTEALSYVDSHGYKMGAVLSMRHAKAHRVIFAIHFGEWPSGHIDHIDGDRANNRIENLRSVSHAENQRNMGWNRRNRSGTLGVFYLTSCDRWWAYIGSGPTRRTIGYFDRIEDARAARILEESRSGFHPNHGKRLNNAG